MKKDKKEVLNLCKTLIICIQIQAQKITRMKKTIITQFVCIGLLSLSTLSAQMPYSGASAFLFFPDAGQAFSITTAYSVNNLSLQIGYSPNPKWTVFASGAYFNQQLGKNLGKKKLITHSYGMGVGFQTPLKDKIKFAILAQVEKRYIESESRHYQKKIKRFLYIFPLEYYQLVYGKRTIYHYPSLNLDATILFEAEKNVHIFFLFKYDFSMVKADLLIRKPREYLPPFESQFFLHRIEPGMGIHLGNPNKLGFFILAKIVNQQYILKGDEIPFEYLPEEKAFVATALGVTLKLRPWPKHAQKKQEL